MTDDTIPGPESPSETVYVYGRGMVWGKPCEPYKGAEAPYEVQSSSEDREAWLAQRRKLLTASDVATVVGLNEYKTRAELLAEKRGEVEPENLEEDPRFQTEWKEGGFEQYNPIKTGTDLETYVGGWWHEVTGHRATTAGQLLVSTATPWLGATPDFWVEEGNGVVGIMETKVVNAFTYRTAKGKPPKWDQGGPLHYRLQLQCQLYVTGLSYGWLCGMVGGNKLVAWRYEFDEGAWGVVLHQLEDFWDDVQR